MKLFDGKLELNMILPVEDTGGQFVLEGCLIDNTGEYFADSIQENDIIYSLDMFYNLLRYKVVSVNSNSGMDFTISVKWDIPNEDVVEPEAGNEFIIGRCHEGIETANVTDGGINEVSALFIQKVMSYQFSLGSKVNTDDIEALRERIEEAVFTLEDIN